MPDVLKQMQAKLEKYHASQFSPDRGKVWPGACEYALESYQDFGGLSFHKNVRR